MSTRSVESAPTRFNYYKGPNNPTAVTGATYNPRGAYTEGEATTFIRTVYSSADDVGVVFYDGFSFNGINSNTEIIGFKLKIKGCSPYEVGSNTNSYVGFRLVTDYYNGQTNNSSNNYYTSISNEAHLFFNRTTPDNTYRIYEYENTDQSSTEVAWLRNNISKIMQGTKLGVRMYGMAAVFREFTFTIFTEDTSKIHVGGVPVSEVYVGSQKASAVYLGSTKIL